MPDHDLSKEQALKLWQQANAVCFDVDCTITKQDALDNLGEFLGVGEKIRDLTNAAMNGELDLDQALQQRLDAMDLTMDKLVAYARSNRAADRLNPGIADLIQELQARNVAVFLISGGFRELILPVADLLQIPRSNIFANRFVYVANDEVDNDTQYPGIKVQGFDPNEPTSREGGKPQAIRQIRSMHPYNTIVMVGDGITDLEAVQETGGADLFIGYGGVIQRPAVKESADWFITDFRELNDALPQLNVTMIGSGAWACAAMQMASRNAARDHLFNSTVKMWVFEEEWQGGKLTDKMNELKENPKYLPGVKYGDNVVACPDLVETIQDADLIIFCTPHQFVQGLCRKMQMHVKPTAHAISLIKGMYVNPETGPQLITSMIRKMLSIECSVLMGANIATEITPNGLCESTIASHNVEHGKIFKSLFDSPFFSVNVIADVEGAELAGTLKNIVAIAAGFSDGCNLGQNAKAAILRQGLLEMRMFAKAMFPTVRDETFYESCGMADLIATCYGGRNHKVAQAFAECNGKQSFADLESDLLKGQKLQGVLTSEEVMLVLKSRHWIKDYPLFTLVDVIARGLLPPRDISRFHEFTKSSTLERMVQPKTRGGRRMSLLEKKMII